MKKSKIIIWGSIIFVSCSLLLITFIYGIYGGGRLVPLDPGNDIPDSAVDWEFKEDQKKHNYSAWSSLRDQIKTLESGYDEDTDKFMKEIDKDFLSEPSGSVFVTMVSLYHGIKDDKDNSELKKISIIEFKFLNFTKEEEVALEDVNYLSWTELLEEFKDKFNDPSAKIKDKINNWFIWHFFGKLQKLNFTKICDTDNKLIFISELSYIPASPTYSIKNQELTLYWEPNSDNHYFVALDLVEFEGPNKRLTFDSDENEFLTTLRGLISGNEKNPSESNSAPHSWNTTKKYSFSFEWFNESNQAEKLHLKLTSKPVVVEENISTEELLNNYFENTIKDEIAVDNHAGHGNDGSIDGICSVFVSDFIDSILKGAENFDRLDNFSLKSNNEGKYSLSFKVLLTNNEEFLFLRNITLSATKYRNFAAKDDTKQLYAFLRYDTFKEHYYYLNENVAREYIDIMLGDGVDFSSFISKSFAAYLSWDAETYSFRLNTMEDVKEYYYQFLPKLKVS